METSYTEVKEVQRRSSLKNRTGAARGVPRFSEKGNGNGNHADERSQRLPTGIPVPVKFRVTAEGARAVSVAGTFNDWDASKTPLSKTGNCWQAQVDLPRGRYEYRFVIDGKWVSDPCAQESAANPFGEANSVLSV